MSDGLLYLGTRDGIVSLRWRSGSWKEANAALKGVEVSCVAHRTDRPREVFVGTLGHGLYVSSDAGHTWRAAGPDIPLANVRAIFVDPDEPRRVFVGTEPVGLFSSDDGGRSWTEVASLSRVPGHERWYLPLYPRAGAVRALAKAPGKVDGLLVGIEMGGVVLTTDGGGAWTNLTNGLNEDVHQLWVPPSEPAVVFVATGAGIYRSFDLGQTWAQVSTNYTRAIAGTPGKLQTIFAGPSMRVGHLGRVERSPDAGSTWEEWSRGLGDPLPGMINQLVVRDGRSDDLGGLFAVLSSGEVYHSPLDVPNWTALFDGASPQVTVIDVAS